MKHVPIKQKDKETIRKERAYLLKKSVTKRIVKKGDKRITEGTRVCVVCQRPLTETRVVQGFSKGGIPYNKYETKSIRDHYVLSLGKNLSLSLCKDSKSCYAQHKQGGG